MNWSPFEWLKWAINCSMILLPCKSTYFKLNPKHQIGFGFGTGNATKVSNPKLQRCFFRILILQWIETLFSDNQALEFAFICKWINFFSQLDCLYLQHCDKNTEANWRFINTINCRWIFSFAFGRRKKHSPKRPNVHARMRMRMRNGKTSKYFNLLLIHENDSRFSSHECARSLSRELPIFLLLLHAHARIP